MDLLYSPYAYSLILLVSLFGLWLCDRRWHLVAYQPSSGAKHATITTLLIGVSFFLVWDIAGIILGIFSTNPRYVLGLNFFTPNLPIEEVLFLTLLIYVSLISVVVAGRQQAKRASKPRKPEGRKS